MNLTKNRAVNSGALEGLAVPAPHETPIVLLLKYTPCYQLRDESSKLACILSVDR